jgi:hypothetical protein
VNSPPKILTEWIDIATCGLIAPARDRIREEVEAHFADAVEARMAGGLSVENAEVVAVHELGDARTAAWRFRKNHLTEADLKRLAWIQKSHQRNETSAARRLEITMAAWLLFMSLTWNAGGWSKLCLIGFIGYLWNFFERPIRRRLFHPQLEQYPWSLAVTRRFLRYALGTNLVALFGATVGCWIVCRSALLAGLAGLAVCGLFGFSQVGVFRLWRKLHYIQEFPLGNA